MRRLYQNFKESDQQCCQKKSSKLRILCLPYLKRPYTAVGSLQFFLYSILMLLNLDLIIFWPTSDKQGCHFT
ncbi:hypothetical protein O3M35_002430 [Rhynocoris fuscipes]|uniref:Uncharacterized protein n=1 Tax=Rhynocoris fuscipes TaxID=488301 RepID=A0AAW1CLD2_9HEMI